MHYTSVRTLSLSRTVSANASEATMPTNSEGDSSEATSPSLEKEEESLISDATEAEAVTLLLLLLLLLPSCCCFCFCRWTTMALATSSRSWPSVPSSRGTLTGSGEVKSIETGSKMRRSKDMRGGAHACREKEEKRRTGDTGKDSNCDGSEMEDGVHHIK